MLVMLPFVVVAQLELRGSEPWDVHWRIKGLVYLWKAIRMRTENSYISWLGFWVVDRYILLHSEVQNLFLTIGGGRGILSKMLARHQMFNDLEGKWRHYLLLDAFK